MINPYRTSKAFRLCLHNSVPSLAAIDCGRYEARRDDALIEARCAPAHLRKMHVDRARRSHHNYLRSLRSLRECLHVTEEVAP